MRLAFACPFYGPTYPAVGFGQRANIANAAAKGHVWEDDYSTNGMQHREACQTMLRKGAEDERLDALFWTEHDIVLPPRGVERLVAVLEETDADIVTGVVFRRCPPYSPMVSRLVKLTHEQYERVKTHNSAKMRELAAAWTFEEFNERNLITLSGIAPAGPAVPVDSASMGCFLIRRTALEKLKDVPGLFDAEQHFSIDNQFFRHAVQKQGLKLLCAQDVLCGHLGDPEIIGVNDWHRAVNEIVEKVEEYKANTDPDIPQHGVLTRLARKHGTDKGPSCHHFTDIYEAFLSPLRKSARNVLEIGVWKGASLRMWRDYFPDAHVHGWDIAGVDLGDESHISVQVVDQCNREQLILAARSAGVLRYDLIVDDGGHHMDQQQTSLAVLFNWLRPGGIYILEDLHTSLMYPGWGIAEDRGNTTLQMIERFISEGVMVSKHMTMDEMAYLTGQVAECRIFRGKSPLSLTCVMVKRGEA